MRPIRAVLFDVYGTLVEVANPRRPYRQLIELASLQQGPIDRQQAARTLMCRTGGIADAASWLRVQVTAGELRELDQALNDEIASIRLFPETEGVLVTLRDMGMQIGVCSNLASPYIAPAVMHLGHLIDKAAKRLPNANQLTTLRQKA